MRQAKKVITDDDILPEYDFTGAVRGKHYERYQRESIVIVLDPDVAEAFPNATAVNEALRLLLSLARAKAFAGKAAARAEGRPNPRLQRTGPASRAAGG